MFYSSRPFLRATIFYPFPFFPESCCVIKDLTHCTGLPKRNILPELPIRGQSTHEPSTSHGRDAQRGYEIGIARSYKMAGKRCKF